MGVGAGLTLSGGHLLVAATVAGKGMLVVPAPGPPPAPPTADCLLYGDGNLDGSKKQI